jgi:MFS family permease
MFVISVACAGWAFSFGVSAPLASLWLEAAGSSDAVIGWNGGVHYLGIAFTALAVPALMRRWSTRSPAAGLMLSGLVVVAFPWMNSLAMWFTLRALHGVGGAMTLIPLETYVNRDLSAGSRARNFAIYAVALTVGYATGNLIGLQVYSSVPYLTFALGGMSAILAAVPILVWLPSAPSIADSVYGSRPQLLRNFLSYGSAWAQGFLEAGMVVFLPLYLVGLSMTESEVGWLMGCVLIGVILVQVPIAWLADRFGRSRVLMSCYLVALIGLLALPWCGPGFWLTCWLFVVGAFSGAFYPLGLALLGERIPASQIAQANAWYLMLECVGSWAGAVCMGEAREWWGAPGMFTAGAVIVAMIPVMSLGLRWCGVGYFSAQNGLSKSLAA